MSSLCLKRYDLCWRIVLPEMIAGKLDFASRRLEFIENKGKSKTTRSLFVCANGDHEKTKAFTSIGPHKSLQNELLVKAYVESYIFLYCEFGPLPLKNSHFRSPMDCVSKQVFM